MNIYVGNLSDDTTEAELREAFEAFGQVASAKVITDKFTGERRGFAFVEMDSEDQAKEAIAGLNGKDLKGQALIVKEARPRRQSGQGGRPTRPYASEGANATRVFVSDDVEKALRVLKKKLSEDGDHRRLKERKHFTPRSKRRRKKAIRSQKSRRR